MVTLSDAEPEPTMPDGKWSRSAKNQVEDYLRAMKETPLLPPQPSQSQPSISLVSDDEDGDEPVMKDGKWTPSAEVEVPEELASLSPQQKEVLDRILRGENIFFTGAAGTGKSHLFRAIIKALRGSIGGARQVAVTASTGMAAL